MIFFEWTSSAYDDIHIIQLRDAKLLLETSLMNMKIFVLPIKIGCL